MITKNQCRIWIEKLRSGEYKQGRKVLRDISNQYCCLGVLADIIDSNAWKLEKYQRYYAWSTTHCMSRLTFIELPGQIQQTLINMNDGDRADFNKIANHIEKNILPVCVD